MNARSVATKDSGIDWIGSVPNHWSVQRLKFIATLAYGDSLSTEKRVDGDVPVFGSNGQVGTHEQANTVGKTIIIGRKGSYGKINLSMNSVFAIDTTYFIDKRFTKANIDWLYWLLSCLRLDSFSKDSAVPGLAREDAYERSCPVPPNDEQSAIACFINHETARIDALIEKKCHHLKLLEEKRFAIITHAVTNGLDPKVPLKDSGIDWLGRIPTHWDVKKLKYTMSHIVDCVHTTPNYDGDLRYPAVRTADLERGRLLLEQVRLVSQEVYQERIQRLRPLAGDILYSREGERFGMAALVPHGVDLCLGQRTMMFRSLPDFASQYLMWALNSEAIYQQVILYTGGATSPHINIGDIINFYIPCPPHDEQMGIAEHIEHECSQLDQVSTKLRDGIAKIQEYRSTLITNAVAGKIDVRGLTKSEVAA
jgi:type I restriction enzyme, S subunit